MKQLALGCMMYAQDYDEVMPRTRSFYARTLWANEILPYVKNEGVFRCPSADPFTWPSAGLNSASRAQMSYGYTWDNSSSNAMLAGIDNPSETVYLADSLGYMFYPEGTGGTERASAGTGYRIQPRHNEGANLGFVDGHAKWYSESAINAPNRTQGLDWDLDKNGILYTGN
ncbi:MAG: H-X9-DG-CTERM domain-containing protein [Armatimonadota bacterium]